MNKSAKTYKPCTNDECVQYQEGMDNFVHIVRSANIPLITRYVKDGTPQYDGTQTAELRKYLSGQELARAQRNVKFYCLLGEIVLKANKLIEQHLEDTKDDKPITPSETIAKKLAKETGSENSAGT